MENDQNQNQGQDQQQRTATNPGLLGVQKPKGHRGPWPTADMDGGDPSSWLEAHKNCEECKGDQ